MDDRIPCMLTYARARAMTDRILDRCAADGGKPVAVAVVDDRGDLVAFARQDGVTHRSLRIAQDKAYTAALQESSTKDFADFLIRTNRTVGAFADPRYVTLAGGVPIPGGGAVGVSGRSADEDHALAQGALSQAS
jgi:uncharacterized protein GlcG (DUF336 family)